MDTPTEADDEREMNRDLMLSMLSAIKTSKPPAGSTVTPIKKEVAPNLFHTQGVHLTVDGIRYLLSMDALQEMNAYQLPSTNAKIYTHIPLVEVASKIWEGTPGTDEDADTIAARVIVDKHLQLSKAPAHLNPTEKSLHFAACEPDE